MTVDSNTLLVKLQATLHSWQAMAKTERERQDWVRGVIYGITLAMKCLPHDGVDR